MNPYVGLRPFDASERERFFGRDQDRQVFVDLVLAHRFTLLFAGSGVGKSSLLRAAVLPQLTDPAHENLDAVYCWKWAGDPLTSIRTATLDELIRRGRLEESARRELSDLPLPRLFEICGQVCRCPLVLVLDQFEEFFYYHRGAAGFPVYREQIVRLILDERLPLSVVISMREDFALSLNAFKPDLPTVLFNNYYRLERLSVAGARAAIERPARIAGYEYESALMERLLSDLSARERDSRAAGPVSEAVLSVEPPYLQIICEQLFELDQRDPGRRLRLLTYERQGGARGLLRQYIERKLATLDRAQQRIASGCFSHLATRRGTKVAHTAESLAREIDADVGATAAVLRRLEKARLLRQQAQDETIWYELYHDMFSESIEAWNIRFRAEERTRKMLAGTAGALGLGILLLSGINAGVQLTSHHLRLPTAGENEQVELWRGRADWWDPFKLHRYVGETGVTRQQLELDKARERTALGRKQDLYPTLIGMQSASDRMLALGEDGNLKEALRLVAGALENRKNADEASAVLKLGSRRAFGALARAIRSEHGPDLRRRMFKDGEPDRTRSLEDLLIEYLDEAKAGARDEVIEQLGTWRSRRAAPTLAKLLAEGGGDQGVAGAALVAIAPRETTEQLIGLVRTQRDSAALDVLVSMALGGGDADRQHLRRALRPLLPAADPSHKVALLGALGKLGEEVETLAAHLDDNDEQVALAAAQALAGRQDGRALARARARAQRGQSPSLKVRWEEALAELGDPGPFSQMLVREKFQAEFTELPDLLRGLDRVFESLCTASRARRQLLRVPPEVLAEVLVQLREPVQRKIVACLDAGPQLLALSRLMLGKPDMISRSVAVDALRRLDGGDSDQLLLRAAGDVANVSAVRVAALASLANHDPARRTPAEGQAIAAALRPLVESPGAGTLLRRAATKALARWDRDLALPTLLKLLGCPDRELRSEAMSQIAFSAHPAPIRALLRALRQQSPMTMEQLDPLSWFGDADAIAQIDQDLKHLLNVESGGQTAEWRRQTIELIGTIGHAGIVDVAFATLEEAADAADRAVQDRALSAMANTGDRRWFDRSIRRAKIADSTQISSAARLLMSWARPDDLATVAQLMARHRRWVYEEDRELLELESPLVLERISESKNHSTPRAAAYTRGFPELVERDQSLRDWQEDDLPELARLLHSPRLRDRLMAVRTLGTLQLSEEARRLLQGALEHDDLTVVRHAVRAIWIFDRGMVATLRHALLRLSDKGFVREIKRVANHAALKRWSVLEDPRPGPDRRRLYSAICQDAARSGTFDPTTLRLRERELLAEASPRLEASCAAAILKVLGQDRSTDVRAAAARRLPLLPGGEGLPVVYPLLRDNSGAVRLAAAKGLERAGKAASVDAIEAALADPQMPVRVSLYLLRALGKIGTDRASAVLMSAIERDEVTFGLRGYRVLGDMRATGMLARLRARLERHRREVAAWRAARDRVTSEDRPTSHPSGYLIFELGLAISRLETDAGAIALLHDDLADVRDAAGLGLSLRLRVPLLDTLQRLRQDSADPLLRHATFHAVDLGLRMLEKYGNQDELAQLKALGARCPDEAVRDRIDYTITELAGRLEDEHEQAGAAETKN